MVKASETLTNEKPKDGATAKRKPAKMSDVATKRTDLPEFISARDLLRIFPFTLYGVSGPRKGRLGPKFWFNVGYKDGGETVKKVLTLSENEDRTELAFQIRKHGAITNCRLIEINLSGGATYWKVIDADEQLPESMPELASPDDDVPF